MEKDQPKKKHGLTGRPGNAAKENPRTIKRTIRLTKAEDYAIYFKAQEQNITVAEYMRSSILHVCNKKRKKSASSNPPAKKGTRRESEL